MWYVLVLLKSNADINIPLRLKSWNPVLSYGSEFITEGLF